MSSVILCLNKDDDKKVHDRIKISKQNGFLIEVHYDITNVSDKKPSYTNTTMNHSNVLDFLEDCLALLVADIDIPCCTCIDLMIAGRPVVGLNPKNPNTKSLLLNTIRNWCLQG